jgi:hypothetical protein
MTPGEKLVLNTIVVVLLSLLIIGIVTYLPKLLVRTAVKLVYFYAGANDKLSVNSTAAILHENEFDEGVQEVSKPPARTTKESRHFGPLQHLRQQEARADVCQVFSKCIPLSPTHWKTARWFTCPSLDMPFLQPAFYLAAVLYDERLKV